MSDRKLATIRRIADIREIPGADAIVCAVVDGWELVTQKSNNFSVGDLVLYFEVDSVLPELPEFEFLRDRCYVSEKNSINGAGFRLKTIRLRGQISQGLILPLEEFDATYGEVDEPIHYYLKIGDGTHLYSPQTLTAASTKFYNTIEEAIEDKFRPDVMFVKVNEGDDVTDLLGVVKYEKPIPASLGGVAKGNFPSFLTKTDSERIQNIYRKMVSLDTTWETSIKLDGTSFTAYVNDGEFGVCSRNLDLKETEGNAYWDYVNRNGLREKMVKYYEEYNTSFAIQGELIGPGIQGNQEKLTQTELYVFDVIEIERKEKLENDIRLKVIKDLGLNSVPILDTTLRINDWTMDDFIKYSEGPSLNSKLREGVVFKAQYRRYSDVNFKVISPKWLISYDA